MGKTDICTFVQVYKELYYHETTEKDYFEDKCKRLGVRIKNPVDSQYEDRIEKKLHNKEYDVECFSWKLGIAYDGDGQDIIIFRRFGFPVEEITRFCDEARGCYTEELSNEELFSRIADLSNSFPEGIGTVQIINAMYFLSGGRIPIYDYYAHVAVKALLLEKSPQEIYVGEAPFKLQRSKGIRHADDLGEKHFLGVNLLVEYIMLLDKLRLQCVENCYWNNNGMLITRDLDRALWVYGHAHVNWYEVSENASTLQYIQ